MDELSDKDKYIDEWTRMMLIIWREKIERLKIVRSGAFHESLCSAINRAQSGSTSISMKFAQYGIYQALGVGNGYTQGNGGDLKILDDEYREKNGLNVPRQAGPMEGYAAYKTSGKPRKVRDWFSKKLFVSTMAMVEDLARIMGEESALVVCNALEDARATVKQRRP